MLELFCFKFIRVGACFQWKLFYMIKLLVLPFYYHKDWFFLVCLFYPLFQWLVGKKKISYAFFFQSHDSALSLVLYPQDTMEEVHEQKWLGKTNFVEIRSFWQIFRSFDRMWSLFILSLQVCIAPSMNALWSA